MTPYAAASPSAWFDAVIIAADGAGQEAVAAIALSGGRLVARIDWADAGAELSRLSTGALLCLETEGVGDDLLATALPRIDSFVAASGRGMVIALAPDQIDIVAAHLLAPQSQLLCAPTLADRVAAFAIVAESMRSVPAADRLREGAARLQYLNTEVARIAEVLARLTRKEDRALAGVDLQDRRGGYGAEPASNDISIDPQEIRLVIRSRRLRDQYFGSGMFEDPAWDMLLDLFAAHLEHSRVSVSSLCIASAVAPTTALRWIAKMTEAGLFERQPDPLDRRRAFMGLSDKAVEGMRGYVAAARRQGLALA